MTDNPPVPGERRSPVRLAPQEPAPLPVAGWRVVPVEPTEKMKADGGRAVPAYSEFMLCDIYRAMLDASPPAPLSPPVGGWTDEQVEALLANPPKHRFWRPGEADCPRDIKSGNGELHTVRCKVCGLDNPRTEACLAAFRAGTGR